MGWVTEDQIERAKQIDVLEYIQRTEPNNIRRVGREYRLKDHESLAVSPGKWYWHSRGIGGRTAVGYLTDVRGYGFVDAVCLLLNERPQEQQNGAIKKRSSPFQGDLGSESRRPPPERKTFALPLRNGDNRRVLAYLQGRGIDRELILNCIENGSLYESKGFHNAVFVGRDERGKLRFAAMRGTLGSFKQDAEGSDKRYGFIIPPGDQNSREIAVFEAPVDCLSHQTLCKQGFIRPFDGWRLSLGGTSILALEQFLKHHSDVKHCLVCTDGDEAGNLAAAKISKLVDITATRYPPAYGSDWNDTLVVFQKSERSQNRVKSIERSW